MKVKTKSSDARKPQTRGTIRKCYDVLDSYVNKAAGLRNGVSNHFLSCECPTVLILPKVDGSARYFSSSIAKR